MDARARRSQSLVARAVVAGAADVRVGARGGLAAQLQQQRVGEHQRRHGLDDGHRARGYAGVVAAAVAQYRGRAAKGDCGRQQRNQENAAQAAVEDME